MGKDDLILGGAYKDSIIGPKTVEGEINRAYSELNQIFNRSIPICVIDKNLDLVKVNETYASLIGKNKEDIIGRKCYDVWVAQNCHTPKCSVKMIMGGMEQWKYEKERKKSSSKSTFIMDGSPFRSPQGEVIGIIENFIDITEKKETEQELRRSEEKFRTIIDQSVVGILIIQDNLVQYINQPLLDFSGYTREEVEKWNPGDFIKVIHPDFRERLIEITTNNQSGDAKIPIYEEIKVIKKNGEISWVEIYARSINYQGRPAGMNITVDITDRKKVEQNLKESELNLKMAQEMSHIGHWKLNTSTEEVLGSDELFDIFGLSHEEATLKKFAEVVHPDDREYDLYHIRRGMEAGEGWDIEHRLLLRDGTLKWVHAIGESIRDEMGKIIMLIGTVQDITEKKEIDRLILEENEKLLEISQMRKDLITRISHELKTPLTSLYGVSQALLEIPKEELNAEILEYREIAQRGCIRLKELIDNLLDASRLDSKRVELRTSKENLVELIKECAIDIMYWVNERGHTLTTDLPTEIFFEIDKLRFSQVLINIISNAIKNTPLGGKILVKINETTEFIDIQVKDTGVGLTDKEKQKIFQKFGKIERYGKNLDVDIEGAGLGLYISKEIVELHGGQILVESKGRNKGAAFTIRLFKKEISES